MNEEMKSEDIISQKTEPSKTSQKMEIHDNQLQKMDKQENETHIQLWFDYESE